MNSKAKFRWEILLYVGLTLAVIISFVFSYLIWANPARVRVNQEDTVSQKEGKLTANSDKVLTDIYQPVNVIENISEGEAYQISSSKVDLVEAIQKNLANRDFTLESRQSYPNVQAYQKILGKSQMLLLTYASPVTVKQALSWLGSKTDRYEKHMVNRILIPRDNSRELYLLNDQDQVVYRYQTLEKSRPYLNQLLTDKDITKTLVSLHPLGDKWVSIYPQGIEVAQYSYLTERQASGLYVNKLLGSTTNITTKEQDGQNLYTDGQNRRLKIVKKTGQVTYSNYNTKEKSLSFDFSNLAKMSFREMLDLGLGVDDLRYAGYQNDSITYRTYITTYPLLGADNIGSLNLRYRKNGQEKMEFSLLSLQVPIPAANDAVTLPPTQEVLDQVIKLGYKVNDIQVGYNSRENTSASQVVDLTPTYFFLVDNKWQSYQALTQSE